MSKSSFEEEIQRKGYLLYRSEGDSMLPLIRQGRDLVLIAAKPEGRLKKYDVPLYRRDSGQYVLHRILKVRENDYVLCGDNRRHRETGISDRHIIGVLTAVIRDGKKLPTTAFRYRLYTHLWCDLFYVRALWLWCRDSWARIRRKCCRKHKAENGWDQTSEQLIYLISCALNGTEANADFLHEPDLVGLFVLARKHSVAAMVCMALEKTDVWEQAEPAVKKRWTDAKNKAVRKNMLLDADCQILMDEMESAGIWHMPLKGSVLKDWYPQYGMREMSDIDILFDETKREQVREIFLRHDYDVRAFRESNHDVYCKPPVYNFEMHTSLLNENYCKELGAKYQGIAQKLIPDENKKFRFHFTPEDFYIYAIIHAYKHYSLNGTGVRSLADIYVMNRKIGPSMDWDYVKKETEALGIDTFEKNSRTLAEKIFSDVPVSQICLTAEERIMLLSCMGAGTYGSFESSINSSLRSLQADKEPITGFTKFQYCMVRLFPGREWCKNNYPFVYRHPCLLPFFWIWRWSKKIPMGKKRIQKEISAVRSSR